MEKIILKTVGENLFFENRPELFSGDIGAVTLKVNFDEVWNGFGRTAVFCKGVETPVFKVLDENDECKIPSEILADPCKIFIGVFGVLDGVTITSELISYKFGKGVDTYSVVNPEDEPDPDVYQQILSNYGKTIQMIKQEIEDRKQAVDKEIADRTSAVAGVDSKVDDLKSTVPFAFGIDANSNYGYIPVGGTNVVPFGSASGSIEIQSVELDHQEKGPAEIVAGKDGTAKIKLILRRTTDASVEAATYTIKKNDEIVKSETISGGHATYNRDIEVEVVSTDKLIFSCSESAYLYLFAAMYVDTGDLGQGGEPVYNEVLTRLEEVSQEAKDASDTANGLSGEVGALKSDLIEQSEMWSDYEWIEIADEQSTGRILVGWNMEKYPDGSWLNKGADSYSYKKFNCDGIDKFKISYSTVQNKVANYAFYDSNENLVSIYPTTALGTESQLTDKEVEVPSGAKWFYVVSRTESIANFGFKIYKSTKTIIKSLNSELLQKKFDSFTDSESSIIINRHVVNDNSIKVNEIGALNEYKYPLFPYFGGEYLEHWYEKIYDGTESIIVDIEGDSISQGYTGQNCFLGMRDFAIKKIMKNGGYDLSKLTVFNNAIGGCSTNDWVGRTEYFKGSFQTETYYSKYAQGMLHYGMEQNPDLMIIGFGMNDANISTDTLNLKERLALFEGNFREALQRIRGTETVNGREAYGKGVESLSIIITNITNTHNYEERKLENWHIYVNEILKKICHEFKCAYVDFTTLTYGYTTGYEIYSQINTDGQRVSLHPNKYQMAYLMSSMNDLVYPIAMHNINID